MTSKDDYEIIRDHSQSLQARLRAKSRWLESRTFATLCGAMEREAAAKIEELEEEVLRLKRGHFTEEEWHNLRHNLLKSGLLIQ